MLNDRRGIFYRRMAAVYSVVAIVGFALGLFWPLVAVALALHVGWSLFQLDRLLTWLRDFDAREPPETGGAWGQVFDELWHLRRQQRVRVRRLDKNLRRVERSVQNLSDGLVIIARTGEIQWWNDAAQSMLQLLPSDTGQALTNLVRDPAFGSWFHLNREHSQCEYVHPRTGRSLQFINNRHAAGNRLLMVRDVTRVKKLEQMRQDFVANASHELRTPLTVLQGYLESFADFPETVPERMRRALSQMLNQTRRMNNLVNDLLLLTRLDSVESQGSTQHTVHVAELLRRVVDDGRELSGEKGQTIELDIQSSGALLGNEDELRSAFSNLVFNAVNYTPEQGQIRVTWRTDSTGAFLEVADNGVGIESRHIPRLTERFYRADPSRSSETGGTGLGLAIVKHALAHHDGRLDIQSEVGQGSQFTCRFPRSRLVSLADPVARSAVPGR